MRDVHSRFYHNCYPCTTRKSYNFCSRNLELGNPTRLVLTLLSSCSLYSCCLLLMTNYISSNLSAFLLYVASVIVLVFILIFHFAPRCGNTNALVFIGICSLMGSLSVKISNLFHFLEFWLTYPILVDYILIIIENHHSELQIYHHGVESFGYDSYGNLCFLLLWILKVANISGHQKIGCKKFWAIRNFELLKRVYLLFIQNKLDRNLL